MIKKNENLLFYHIVQVVSIDEVPIKLTASVFQSNDVKGEENSLVFLNN